MEKIRSGGIPAKAVGLISDNPEAKALEIAKNRGVPTFTLVPKEFPSKEKFHETLLETLKNLKPDLVVTAGFMRILPPMVCQTFRNQILNIHPSLLPAFPGLRAQRQAIEYGAKISGCTVHFVDEGVDTGPILLQEAVAITEKMTEAELSRKILKSEHKILVHAINLFLKEKIKFEGRKVKIIK
jgi:phosphoribosylglycinamide formyltransferase-1